MPSYCTLADLNIDGLYVSPSQARAASPTGPVLLAYHRLDAPSVERHRPTLREYGYLPGIPFNNFVDCAPAKCALTRAHVYMTQAFQLLPPTLSYRVPSDHVYASFKAVTSYELIGRKIIALGFEARNACRQNRIVPDKCVRHPSARGPGLTVEHKATELACAMRTLTV